MPPFAVLHLCLGNICRSPMAERLLQLALRRRLGDRITDRYLSHGAGTGGWHVGEAINPPAVRQLRQRGADVDGFRARKLTGAMIDTADLVLCATADQARYVLELRPDADARTFVLGEFGRLLADASLEDLPPAPAGDAWGAAAARQAYARGVALVAAVDAVRSRGTDPEKRRPPRPSDDLGDPWGMPDREFARVADEIERTVEPLAAALIG